MHKIKSLNILFLTSLLVLQACSWMHREPQVLDSHLIEAMQKPLTDNENAESAINIPLKVHYELLHKPLPDRKLLIALEIKPLAGFAASAYSVKAPEAVKVIKPSGVISIGTLKAGETYREEIWVRPVSEGVYEIEVFVAVRLAEKEPQVKRISIPISTGPFQKSQRE